ncbi:MAG TPA: beta-propeller fold lactonase family protein [Gemmatimonadaceae bacterium]|jgi:6-phosphogluconolactonase (cycloisomerase 2 family)
MKLVRILAALGLAACTGRDATSPVTSDDAVFDRTGEAAVGNVYTQTNDATANAVSVFSRARDGSLTFVANVPTGGRGNGAPGLGSQASVVVARERFLLVANGGSNQISSFVIGAGGGLTLVETIASGGTMPVSIATRGRFVYVLNAGSDNVTGFTLNANGDLTALAGSTRSLSGSGVMPAQVAFDPLGRRLVVTEKGTNKIDVFVVNANGTLGAMTANPSSGMTPFGFEFSRSGRLVVSEAFGGAPNASATSSYRFGEGTTIVPISESIRTTETAACWVVISSNQRYAYVTNTGSNSVTGYALAANGTLRRLTDNGVSGTTQKNPVDAVIIGQILYTLDRGSGGISIFGINANGSLTSKGAQSGLPTTVYGLTAR